MSNVDHLPMQGLPTVPRVIADERPIELANFENEAERAARRDAGTAGGLMGGAAYMVLGSAHIAAMCLLMPPLCLGVAAVGGAIGGAQSTVVSVSAEDANRISVVFREHASSSSLQHLVVSRIVPQADENADKLVVRVVGVLLVPTAKGVTFRLVAQAQAFPAGKPEWKPTVHFVSFPTRPTEEWLASDEKQLKSDLKLAVHALSRTILPAYMPYGRR